MTTTPKEAEAALAPIDAAVELLTSHFGSDRGMQLLHDETGYPDGDEAAVWEQAKRLVRDDVPLTPA